MTGRISVTVKPNAKKASVTVGADGGYQVAVQPPARDGKANEAVIEVLAEYFSVPKSSVKIIRGRNSREKLVVID